MVGKRRWFLPWILIREMGGKLVKQSILQKHLYRTSPFLPGPWRDHWAGMRKRKP